MSINNIKTFLCHEFDKKYYIFLILSSIIFYILILFRPYGFVFCFMFIGYVMEKRNKIAAITSMTDTEMKIAFLLYLLYSIIIFTLSQILAGAIIHSAFRSINGILLYIISYVTSLTLFFLVYLLLLAFFKINRINTIAGVVVSVFFFFLYDGSLLVNNIIARNNSDAKVFFSKFYHINVAYLLLTDTGGHKLYIDDKLKIDIKYKLNNIGPYFSSKLMLEFDTLSVYLFFVSIFTITILFYYFDSIMIAKYLRSIPLFKEIPSPPENS